MRRSLAPYGTSTRASMIPNLSDGGFGVDLACLIARLNRLTTGLSLRWNIRGHSLTFGGRDDSGRPVNDIANFEDVINLMVSSYLTCFTL